MEQWRPDRPPSLKQNTDPTIVDNIRKRTGVKAYLENLLDAHSASQFMEGERAIVPTETSSIKASTVKGGAGLGIGLATGNLLSQLGVNNPYFNAPISGAVGMAGTDLLENAGNNALFRMGSKYRTQVAAKDISMGSHGCFLHVVLLNLVRVVVRFEASNCFWLVC